MIAILRVTNSISERDLFWGQLQSGKQEHEAENF